MAGAGRPDERQRQQRQAGHPVKHGDCQHGGVTAGEPDQQAGQGRADHVDQRVNGGVERVGAVERGPRDEERDQGADARGAQRIGQRIDRHQGEQQRRPDRVQPARGRQAEDQRRERHPAGENGRAEPVERIEHDREGEHACRQA
jgi:hypothetical protein